MIQRLGRTPNTPLRIRDHGPTPHLRHAVRTVGADVLARAIHANHDPFMPRFLPVQDPAFVTIGEVLDTI